MGDSVEVNSQLVLAFIASSGQNGCLNEDLEKGVPNLTNENRVAAINALITKRLIDIFQLGAKLGYKLRPQDNEPADLRNADTEEKIVYGVIKEAGNKGIWMRDIRLKSNLQPTVLNKVLKSLENKKLIKAVKSVSATKKKVYMLFELEPDSTLTGGSWYSDQDFESEFVDVLNQQCYRYLLELRHKHENDQASAKKGPLAMYNLSSANCGQVCKFIADLGVSKVPLSEDDIRTILDTLLYDGKVERKLTINGEFTYRAVNPLVNPPGLVMLPCGICPVISECHLNGSVSPFSCPYMQSWGTKPIIKVQAEEET
uniref:DNA-directed RNA polymerase III subunit RPC6 n=1 Tax=Lygus hesperus TaxID=30085 RepID=A0A0A9WBT8_LYGHE